MNKLILLLVSAAIFILPLNGLGQNPAAKCADALAHPINIPYSSSNDSTCHLGNDFIDANVTPCGNTNYLGGEDRLYVFTAATTGNVQVRVNTSSQWVGIFAYMGCPTNGSCVGTQGGQSGAEYLTFYAIAGVSYYIIIDTWPQPACIPNYTIYIGTPLPPTVQDCLGAIPITSCIYVQNDTLHGSGLIPNEIDTTVNCIKWGEENDVWYKLTIQQSGLLNFVIIPFFHTADFDWAVFNITHRSCDSIFSDPSMCVSCNMSTDTGRTGANGGSPYTSQGFYGFKYNAEIPVFATQVYALLITYHARTDYPMCGYTINFCNSTAVLFDSIPPKINTIVAGATCNSDSLKIKFSEKVKCSSVEASDFALSGPGGPYLITTVHSISCDTGGIGDSTFVLTVSPAMINGGSYHLYIDGPIMDLNGNSVLLPYVKNFEISTMSVSAVITAASCSSAIGTAQITPNGGVGPYQYQWNPNAGNNFYLVNEPAGNYYLTVTDANGCMLDTNIFIGNSGGLHASIQDSGVTCYGSNNGKAVVNVNGGNTPYSYVWSGSGTTTSTVTGLSAGFYYCTVTDNSGCNFVAQTSISEPTIPVANAGNNRSICFGSSTVLGGSIPITGGSPPYRFQWNPTSTLNDSTLANPVASPTIGTSYTLTVTDGNGCIAYSSPVVVSIYPLPPTPTITINGNQLTSSSGVSYQWCFDGVPVTGATNQTYTVGTFGAYTVIVSDANGCTSVSLPYGFVGITSIQNEPPRFSLFPNPNHGKFELSFYCTRIQHVNFVINDVSGRVVYSANDLIVEGLYKQEIDLTRLSKGVYTFSLVSDEYISTKKVIIE